MREYPEAAPFIIVDPDTDLEVARRIEHVDDLIHQDPYLFIKTLETLGSEATEQTLALKDREQANHGTTLKASDIIIEFFKKRYDLDSTYDELTEELISADETHRQLLANLQTRKQMARKPGSEIRDDPEAIVARDAVRRSSLRLYLGRVAAYQAQKQAVAFEAREAALINR